LTGVSAGAAWISCRYRRAFAFIDRELVEIAQVVEPACIVVCLGPRPAASKDERDTGGPAGRGGFVGGESQRDAVAHRPRSRERDHGQVTSLHSFLDGSGRGARSGPL